MSKFIDKGLSEQQRAQVEQMYTQYHRLVRSQIRDRTRCSPGDAEDLTEDVFERVCRSLKSGSGPRNLKATKMWLLKIAENVCGHFMQKTNRQSTLSLESPVFQGEDEEFANRIVDGDGSPEEIAEQNEATRALHTVIEGLPQRQQMIVRLHYGNELTLTEISAISGQPRSTVKRNRDKGIKQLQKRLGDE